MFTIAKKQANGCIEPERSLTSEEEKRVIARFSEGDNFIYFEKGDEKNEKYLRLVDESKIQPGAPVKEALFYFSQLTPEEKKLIADELKPFLSP